jgi:hypothetical protein
MWIELATSATPAIPPHLTHRPAQLTNTHPAQKITGSLDTPSVPWNIFLTECILFMRAALIENMTYDRWYMKYSNLIRWTRKDENRKRKSTVELIWIEPATSATLDTPPTPDTHANQLITACQHLSRSKIYGSLETHYVLWNIFLTECILFMRAAFIENMKDERWDIKYEIWNMRY